MFEGSRSETADDQYPARCFFEQGWIWIDRHGTRFYRAVTWQCSKSCGGALVWKICRRNWGGQRGLSLFPSTRLVRVVHLRQSELMAGGYAYILCNRRNGTIYTGATGDLHARMEEHKSKTNPKSLAAQLRKAASPIEMAPRAGLSPRNLPESSSAK